eukprot:TRINITY_DN5281_c2_g1_i1.p1 TRINITY_DN5281_c2_g1~~TRINITY_DN5281_c2_g1_i1.p1  ORF type:complete len:571 (+),score=145.69 TRINITY_DN5281_c2_g1_i1:130-1842(+)
MAAGAAGGTCSACGLSIGVMDFCPRTGLSHRRTERPHPSPQPGTPAAAAAAVTTPVAPAAASAPPASRGHATPLGGGWRERRTARPTPAQLVMTEITPVSAPPPTPPPGAGEHQPMVDDIDEDESDDYGEFFTVEHGAAAQKPFAVTSVPPPKLPPAATTQGGTRRPRSAVLPLAPPGLQARPAPAQPPEADDHLRHALSPVRTVPGGRGPAPAPAPGCADPVGPIVDDGLGDRLAAAHSDVSESAVASTPSARRPEASGASPARKKHRLSAPAAAARRKAIQLVPAVLREGQPASGLAAAPMLPTHSRGVDALLAGGVRFGEVTQFAGPPGGGKTVLCHHLCLSAAARGLRTVYIDTAANFNLVYLYTLCKTPPAHEDICRARRSDRWTTEQLADRVVRTPCEVLGGELPLHVALAAALGDVLSGGPQLVIVDSAAGALLHTLNCRSHMQTSAARRGAVLSLRLMRALAAAGCAVVATNHAAQISAREAAAFGPSAPDGRDKRPLCAALGPQWGSTVHTTLWVEALPDSGAPGAAAAARPTYNRGLEVVAAVTAACRVPCAATQALVPV